MRRIGKPAFGRSVAGSRGLRGVPGRRRRTGGPAGGLSWAATRRPPVRRPSCKPGVLLAPGSPLAAGGARVSSVRLPGFPVLLVSMPGRVGGTPGASPGCLGARVQVFLGESIPGALRGKAVLGVVRTTPRGALQKRQLLPAGRQVPGQAADQLVFSQALDRLSDTGLHENVWSDGQGGESLQVPAQLLGAGGGGQAHLQFLHGLQHPLGRLHHRGWPARPPPWTRFAVARPGRLGPRHRAPLGLATLVHHGWAGLLLVLRARGLSWKRLCPALPKAE